MLGDASWFPGSGIGWGVRVAPRGVVPTHLVASLNP